MASKSTAKSESKAGMPEPDENATPADVRLHELWLEQVAATSK